MARALLIRRDMRNDISHRVLRRARATSLQSAELRRLDHDVITLEASAEIDPVLRTMLAAARACRIHVARHLAGR